MPLFSGVRGRGILRSSHLGGLRCRIATCEATVRHACRVSYRLQCPTAIEKGKPVARRGRKAYGPPKEVAGLPNRPWRDRSSGYQQEEWEPPEALRTALGDMPLSPAADRN